MWGSLKWDDDNLAPGNSKDGGLHNNLFDSDGKLQGAARFIPQDKPDPAAEQPIDKPGTKPRQKKPDKKAQKQRKQPDPGLGAVIKGDAVELLGEMAKTAVKQVAIEVAPHAKRLWEEKGRPAFEAKRAEAAHDAKVLWDEKGKPLIERRLARRREKLATSKSNKILADQPNVIEGEVVSVKYQ